MQDPTRITGILNALRRTWEGQPDLSLSQLIGVLQNRGLGWASTDEEAVALLQDLEREHPSLIDGTSGPHTVTTVNPPQLVTLSDDLVVVRSGEDAERMPAAWRWSSMRKAGPGLPLVIADTGGVEHRLGVVTLVTRLGEPEASISMRKRMWEAGGGWCSLRTARGLWWASASVFGGSTAVRCSLSVWAGNRYCGASRGRICK